MNPTESVLAVIGSEELHEAPIFDGMEAKTVEVSGHKAEMRFGRIGGKQALYVPRSGSATPRKCHEIDYRGVMRALRSEGATHVIATAMVGSLTEALPVGHLCLLNQFIDFTRHRQFTYFDDEDFDFVDMTEPFCAGLRGGLLDAADKAGTPLAPHACYVGVDGPRYETRAEVSMFRQWGGDVVGMTIVPEVIMAREAGLCYATIAGVVNPGAGIGAALLDARQFRPHRAGHAGSIEQILTSFFTEDNKIDLSCDCPHADV